jgi:hypothetical protein
MSGRIPFRPLPGMEDRTPRPVVDVTIEGLEAVGLPCLVDSGSLHNRFASWVAREAGIDLRRAPEAKIGLGGHTIKTRTVPVRLRLGDHTWEAPVSFCEPWPWGFNILGQEGFLRWFILTLDSAQRTLDLDPAR